jgi:hypothetical protein
VGQMTVLLMIAIVVVATLTLKFILYCSVILCTDIYSSVSLHNLYKSEIFIQFLCYYIFR